MMSAPTRTFQNTADRALFYSICGALVAAPLLIVAHAASQGKMQLGGSIFFLTCSLCYCYFGVMFFVDSSDLLINEAGISRRILGRVCTQTPWSGIKVIRERFIANQKYGGEIRIDVLPKTLHGLALRFRRTIKFSEQIESFDELIEILNAKAEQYAIRIEIASNGIWNSRPRVVANVAREDTGRTF